MFWKCTFRSYVPFLWKNTSTRRKRGFRQKNCMFEGEKRKEVKIKKKVLKSQLRAHYCFTHITHQEIRWRTDTGDCGLQGEKGVSGWTWAWLLFTRLWRNTLNQIFPSQAHVYPGDNGVDESTKILLQWPTMGLRNSHSSETQGLIHIYAVKPLFNEMQKRALCLSEDWEFSSQWIYHLSLDHNLYRASSKVLTPYFLRKWDMKTTTNGKNVLPL